MCVPALTAEAEAGDYDLERGGAWIGGPLSSRVRGSIALASEQESGRVGDDSFEQDALLMGLDTRLGASGELRLRSRLTDWQAEDYPVRGTGG